MNVMKRTMRNLSALAMVPFLSIERKERNRRMDARIKRALEKDQET